MEESGGERRRGRIIAGREALRVFGKNKRLLGLIERVKSGRCRIRKKIEMNRLIAMIEFVNCVRNGDD